MILYVNRQDKEMTSNSLHKVNQYNPTLYHDLNNKKHLMKCAQLSENINKNVNNLDFMKVKFIPRIARDCSGVPNEVTSQCDSKSPIQKVFK